MIINNILIKISGVSGPLKFHLMVKVSILQYHNAKRSTISQGKRRKKTLL